MLTIWELKAEGYSDIEEYFQTIIDKTDYGVPYDANAMVYRLSDHQKQQLLKYIHKIESDQLFPVGLDTFASVRRMAHNLFV